MKQELSRNRAWIEINTAHLAHNVNVLTSYLTKKSHIMAVVKANGYGHDAILVSRELRKLGISDFAVATLDEGIMLRENGIDGNILILGYTQIENLNLVQQYDLIQTIVDYSYAQAIQQAHKFHIKAHLKINTGMNRLGECCLKVDEIASIYTFSSIELVGMYSHLCVADSQNEEDVCFTKGQIASYQHCMQELESRGYNVGVKHIQSSYGLINYPQISCDYVRLGILLYGVHSSLSLAKIYPIDIKPVLTLKARISCIHTIQANESVGYGRTYIASKVTRIASVTIGYADGYPRCLSNTETYVMVRNQYAPIIGRICMDQLSIDISEIDGVEEGDVVTLIGEEELIRAERVAENASTITNELLSRLSTRLHHVSV